MGGRHATAAVHGDSCPGSDAELIEAVAQLVSSAEPAVLGEVVGRRGADGAGDVPGHGVYRFVLAPEALGGAGIEDDLDHAAGDVVGIDGWHRAVVADRRRHVFRLVRLGVGQRSTGGSPRAQPAVEHLDPLVADPSQQPPGPRRAHPGVVVVDHDHRIRADAPAGCGPLDVLRRRQRVTPHAVVRRAGEVGLEVDVDRPGNVPRGVVTVGILGAELPAHVEHDEAARGFQQPAQTVGGHQRGGSHGRHDRRRGDPVAPPITQPMGVGDRSVP